MSLLRVAYDDQIFRLQSRGGISRYFAELVREFRNDQRYGIQAHYPSRWTLNEHLAESSGGGFRQLPARSFEARLRLRFQPPASIEADVVHHTFYDPRYFHAVKRGIRVTTIYDMIPELYPTYFPRGNPHLEKQLYVRECDVIICISAATKHDLLAVYGDLSKPIHVVHLGVSEAFAESRSSGRAIPGRYFLYVGAREGYKDFRSLLLAFRRVAGGLHEHKLLCVGGGDFSRDELREIAEAPGLERVIHRDVPDGDLADVYSGAEALVVTSRHEGFCLPLVEAGAVGCPVIVADFPVAHEVIGTNASYFPAGDAEALAELLVAPEAWVRRDVFPVRTWRDTARETAEVYRSVCDRRS